MGRKFLIIDDSALMRRVISDIIKQNSEYEVMDMATNGVEGLDKLVAHPSYYDLVILDINMPKMNGLEMLEMLKKNHMHETVVVVSTLAKKGTKETIRALELGALDFVTKPENFFEVKGEGFKTNILNLIEVVECGDLNRKAIISEDAPSKTKDSSNFEVKSTKSSLETRSSNRVAEKEDLKDVIKGSAGVKHGNHKLVAIACSTGGPKSLQQVIPMLPANLDAGIVLVQHMPKGFTASLAIRLDSLSALAVKEAEDGDIIEKGHVYIAPGGKHIQVKKKGSQYVIRHSDNPPIDGLRPCANVMYESLVDSDYDEITCVVLTGMGADGTKGITALSKANKKIHVIGQSAETCVVYGMPRTIAEAGLTNEVEPLEKIAESIIKNVGVL